jgi:putative transposase
MTQTEPQEAVQAASSEPAADFKKSLMDQVRAGGGRQAIDTKQLFQKLVKETLEALLELEMEEHLG